MAGYKSMLEGPCFTFMVGQENKPIYIHKDFVATLSKPLHALMDNGSMTESKTSTARLEDIDYDTFLNFAEYCYVQNYRLPARPYVFNQSSSDEVPKSSLETAARSAPNVFEGSSVGRSTFGQTTSGQSTLGGNTAFLPYAIPAQASLFASPNPPRPTGNSTIRFGPFSSAIPESFLASPSPTVNPLASQALKLFLQRKFDVKNMKHDEYREYLRLLRPADATSNNLIAHAKLWVLADKYLIDELRLICLHKLHRDLSSFMITKESIGEFTRMLAYVYENTPNDEEDSVTTIVCQLRELVISYAAAKAKVLINFQDFRNLLYGEGMLSVDFSSAMVECMQ